MTHQSSFIILLNMIVDHQIIDVILKPNSKSERWMPVGEAGYVYHFPLQWGEVGSSIFFYHCRDNIRKFIKVFKFFLPCFEQFFRFPMFAKMILFTPGCCSPTGSQERNPVSLNFSVC